MPEEPNKEKVALVVGDLLFNESAEMVRRLGKDERLDVLGDEVADTLLAEGEIPKSWQRFGDLHYALVTDAHLNLSTCKALVSDGGERWKKAEQKSGALPPARLAGLAFLCTLKP